MKIPRNIRSRTEKIIYAFIFITFGFVDDVISQDAGNMSDVKEVSELFKNQDVLALKMSYSNKKVKYQTNDSTYIETDITYQEQDGSWKTLAVSIRGRGNYRRKHCYYTPIKMKLDKAIAEKTVFEGNKKLKLVLPCFNCKNANDYILKEYLAYKLYEKIGPYHFKTRLVALEYNNIKGNKVKSDKVMAILVEDIKSVAKRHNGNVFKRHMRPITQDQATSVQNALFQYMIGNTDFSTTFQHNEKQLFANRKIRPVPYDFDMSGFVNTNYAVVSKVQNRPLPIEEVTERLYKGFQRDDEVFETVRNTFINSKTKIFSLIDEHKALFDSQFAFREARDFISSFFKIIEDDKKFQKEVVSVARPMFKGVVGSK